MSYRETFILFFSVLTIFFSASVLCPKIVKAEDSIKAKIESPEGLMRNNTKIKDAADTLNWVVSSVCLLATIFFGVNAGKKLNDEQYTSAVGPLVGAVVAGTATFLAHSIMN